MDKDRVLETINFYMNQVMGLVKRGKRIDPISIMEAFRYIEEEVRKLPSYEDGYQTAITDTKKIIMQTKIPYRI